MIHYTCDRCHRKIDSEHDLRYSVQIEIRAAMDSPGATMDDDRDHLIELHDILERLEDSECEEISQSAFQRRHYDLCQECQQKFVKNPLAVDNSKLEFSDN